MVPEQLNVREQTGKSLSGFVGRILSRLYESLLFFTVLSFKHINQHVLDIRSHLT